MGVLHQHPDGLVYVRTLAATYQDTVENFQLDFAMSLPALPAAADDRIYDQETRHAIMGGGSVVEGGPIPWDLGDAIIAAIDAGLAAQAARLAAAVPPVNLPAYAANRRWQREIGGTAWSGHQVATDRESQTKLLAEFVAIGAGLRADPSPWKFARGEFVALSNANMGAVILAARTHIAAAFALEATVLAAIAAGTVTSAEQIDAAFS